MKKILLTIIAPTILTFSCKQEPKPVINYAILTGKIENVKDANIKINSKYTSISLDTVPTIQQTVNIDKTGAFIDTLFINSSREFSISLGKEFIVFTSKPGQHIELTADGNDFRNSIQFGGDEAAINTYLNKKDSIRTRINNEDRHLKYGDEASFIKKQENKEKEFLNLLNSSQGLPSYFIENEKKDIFYNKLMSYMYYPISYERSNNGKKPELSEGFFNLLDSANLQDFSKFQHSLTYQFLLRGYYNTEYSKTVDNVWTADPLNKLKFIKEQVDDQNILDELFIMYARFDIAKSHDLQAYYDFFMANVSNKTYKTHVTKQYKDLMATQPGNPSPEFVNYKNINGETNSLSDFRGKYVYIDVWATWCGPCKAEIPFLKEIEKKYHNKNIVFISLSVDKVSDTEKWKKFVKENELGGVQLIADKDWKSEFIQKYQIQGIPQFILIDPQGNIVQANAPRPSNEKLIDLFTELGI